MNQCLKLFGNAIMTATLAATITSCAHSAGTYARGPANDPDASAKEFDLYQSTVESTANSIEKANLLVRKTSQWKYESLAIECSIYDSGKVILKEGGSTVSIKDTKAVREIQLKVGVIQSSEMSLPVVRPIHLKRKKMMDANPGPRLEFVYYKPNSAGEARPHQFYMQEDFQSQGIRSPQTMNLVRILDQECSR